MGELLLTPPSTLLTRTTSQTPTHTLQRKIHQRPGPNSLSPDRLEDMLTPIQILLTNKEDPSKAWSKFAVTGQAGRYAYTHPNTPYEQPRILYNKVLNAEQRDRLISNLAGALGGARKDIQE